MKVMLDECVTRKLKQDFQGHEVYTIEEAGMKGLKNGELLRLASEQYDLFVTVDQNLTFQQNLQSLKISVLILAAKKNTYGALKPLMPKALEALKIINPGEVIFIGVL